MNDKFITIFKILTLPAILLITVIAFLPSLNNGFVRFDDPQYLLQNPLVRSLAPENIVKNFASHTWGNYQPLVNISFSFEYAAFKLNPFYYHLDNLILHLINIILVFWMIWLLTGSWNLAAVTAALFAVHPMQVESVAWVSERKNLLFALFYFASAISYLYWLKSDRRDRGKFLACLVLFFLSLLSKPQAVTLPVLLLLFDRYFGRPWQWALVIEKSFFWVLAVTFGASALSIQKIYLKEWGISPQIALDRVLWAGLAFVSYVWKLFFPVDLSCFYPFPENPAWGLRVFIYLIPLFLAAASWFLWRRWKKNALLVFGALFFVLHILPVLQPKENFFMADRYIYVSGIGAFLLIGAGLRHLFHKYPGRAPRTILFAIFLSAVLAFTFLSRERCPVWKDSATLLNNVLAQYPKALKIHLVLGCHYFDVKDYERALQSFEQVIALDPKLDQGYNNRASTYLKMGRYDEALANYAKAIELNPAYGNAYTNRGILYHTLGKDDLALQDFQAAMRINPDTVRARLKQENINFDSLKR